MSRGLGIFTKGKRTRVSSQFLQNFHRILFFRVNGLKYIIVLASSDEFTPVEDEKNNSSESSSEGTVWTVRLDKCTVI